MTQTFDDPTRRRFLRTLRVATNTAVAEYHLTHQRPNFASAAQFLALAAKGPGEWRFPDAGIMSSDGLVLAMLIRNDRGGPAALRLQAQGSVGLAAFAGRDVSVAFASQPKLAGFFDRDGHIEFGLEGMAITEESLSQFELRFADDAP